jgi:hypothetical protein
MTIFSEYLKEQLSINDFNSVEVVVDKILENVNKKEEISKIDSSFYSYFIHENQQEIINIFENYYGINIEEYDEDDFDEYYEDEDEFLDDDEDDWDDELNEEIERVRIVRGNKVLTKKRTNKEGYKLVDGKERRMCVAEIIARKKAQAKAAQKRKIRMKSIMKKREISINNRQNF